ncbi:hypothetical protein FH972_025999 [Carpinus fangiana]|uniref:Transcription initiation factor TFIID subunit 2 n=1 Tax=Carpinus fangiana TaxID=176857 RepID=A0A5N6L599_9ROSI|nr:hypothetical protein FH972_025999 [Carpinus fangiana]
MDATHATSAAREFSAYSQKVELDVDFATQTLKGKTEITLLPLSKQSRLITLNCRQCLISSVTVEGRPTKVEYNEPFRHYTPFPSYGANQHHLHRARLQPQLQSPPDEELRIALPPRFQIQEVNPFAPVLQEPPGFKSAKNIGDSSAMADTPITATGAEFGSVFVPIRVNIEYEIKDFRDGLHFVGTKYPDSRYPHAYTRNSSLPGTACCLFPCIDESQSRCPWEISITAPRTLGDALLPRAGENGESEGQRSGISGMTEEEKGLDMTVVCSGELTDEVVSSLDPTRKTVSFALTSAVSPSQLGFAIGPFELVDLSDLREIDEDEKLGSNAARIHAYCLPGRAAEVRNTCMPLAKAIDFYTTTFTLYPFNNLYKMCFLEDAVSDTLITAGLTLCSTRLLFPDTVLDRINEVVRKLVHALAAQWAGIFIAPRGLEDTWVIVGVAYFMTDLFLKTLSGNNEYRFQQKMAAERVCDLDINRPSLVGLGTALQVHPSEIDFMALKAGVVLFILDRRLAKSSGSSGMPRIINRMFQNAKSGEVEATMVSTTQFQRLCEKLGHLKLEVFFNQWIHGAGCPKFTVRQSFNKKKLVVNLNIEQVQARKNDNDGDLDPNSFMRELKEETGDVWAGEVQPFFSGPMTIRIHEADGTPYEHIVEIKDAKTMLEIPYNTKYKRLKRSRRQKERTAVNNADGSADAQDDVLLYCLGDVLQEPEDVAQWQFRDWPPDTENKMSEESYEWIRMDADFEWICKMEINMPPYMFTSQLQQDRDVVAQYESVHFLSTCQTHPLVSTFLARTLMDRRYFHGIRTAAAQGLPRNAKDELDWIGLFHLEKAYQELFCVPNTSMTRPNDFSDRASYLVQCEIAKAIATIKDNSGRAPPRVKRFFVDKLKFNDNSNNEYSDCYYVSILMSGLAEALTVSEAYRSQQNDDDDDEDVDYAARREAINEIERYRRIDEWISSYQNIYSRTALGCLRHLAQAGVLKPKFGDMLQYTRPGNADLLRKEAFECLSDLKVLKNGVMMKYFLHSFETEPSPFMRASIWKAFGKGLGLLAIGEKEKDRPLAEGGLIIEQDVSLEGKELEFARRKTITGALVALKQEMSQNVTLKDALWSAVKSALLSPREIEDLLDVCEILYDPVDKIVATLRYPRYWSVSYNGNGIVTFRQTAKVRTKMYRLPEPIKPAATKIRFSVAAAKMEQPPPHTETFTVEEPLPVAPVLAQQPKAVAAPKLKLKAETKPKASSLAQSPVQATLAIAPDSGKSKVIRLKLSPQLLRAFLHAGHSPARGTSEDNGTGVQGSMPTTTSSDLAALNVPLASVPAPVEVGNALPTNSTSDTMVSSSAEHTNPEYGSPRYGSPVMYSKALSNGGASATAATKEEEYLPPPPRLKKRKSSSTAPHGEDEFTAPRSKKRKSATPAASEEMSATPQPPKRPVIKLKLSMSKGASSSPATGTTQSPPPPTGS